jgi:hypothetical protein
MSVDTDFHHDVVYCRTAGCGREMQLRLWSKDSPRPHRCHFCAEHKHRTGWYPTENDIYWRMH